MELKEVVKWLLEQNYAILVDGELTLTRKINDELRGIRSPEIVSRPTLLVPTDYSDDPKAIWNKFIEDAKIPHRIQTKDGGRYTVRQYSKGASRLLMKIIQDPEIDYERLVVSTRDYYNDNNNYRKLLINYLEQDIWKDEYDNYKVRSKQASPNPYESL